MTRFIFFLLIACIVSCSDNANRTQTNKADSLTLIRMIKIREAAMVARNIDSITKQFTEDATFINGGGFYYEGIKEIENFHRRMFENDSLTYSYKIGELLVRVIQNNVALVYYPWQQAWTMKNIKSDTLNETGLMTIIAVKRNNSWLWKSITNQRTKEFFTSLKLHKAE